MENNSANLIETFLYNVSSFLYYPVLLSVAVFCLYAVFLLGTFTREWRERKAGEFHALESYKKSLKNLLQNEGLNEELKQAHVERLLQITELEQISQLDKVRFMIRTGPALGLMGTLIPMGTALASLAEGNIPNMAGSMVNAFTATVAGLASSVVAYLIALMREKWLRADIREMEFHTELTMHHHIKENHKMSDTLEQELS
jgi:biopolymer transport protein ExbB/TolQ